MADIVASEGLLLAARELIVLALVVGFMVWAGYRLMHERR